MILQSKYMVNVIHLLSTQQPVKICMKVESLTDLLLFCVLQVYCKWSALNNLDFLSPALLMQLPTEIQPETLVYFSVLHHIEKKNKIGLP